MYDWDWTERMLAGLLWVAVFHPATITPDEWREALRVVYRRRYELQRSVP